MSPTEDGWVGKRIAYEDRVEVVVGLFACVLKEKVPHLVVIEAIQAGKTLRRTKERKKEGTLLR